MTKAKFVFFLFSILGLIVSVLGYFVLPDKFFFDTNIIIKDRWNEIGLVGSYPFSIWFYKYTYLKYLHFSVIGFIQFLSALIILYRIGVPKEFNKLTLKNLLFYQSFIILAIFLAMPTKEYINFLYISIVVFLYKNRKFSQKKTVVVSLGLLIFFSYFFRPYFLLTTFIAVAMYLFSFFKVRNKKILILIYGILISVFFSLSYGLVKGNYISEGTREQLNEYRLKNNDENANSMIISPVKTDKWYGEVTSIFYGFMSVNLPLNGLKHIFSPQIIVFIIWQLLLFMVLFLKFGKCIREGKNNNYELWLFYIIFSYFIVQGIFEPDLGSAIRHKAGIFPLIYYLMYYEEFRKKLS